MSAVWCVVPAVKAAIATGIVDSANVGLWGHSWGGYQTAFLVTQTNIFKAAIAGAPLTDMVSMYSSIYWNTGGADQAIFESSQGRFKGNFTDNYDAYIRNSPDFHAKNVKTPLIILHERQGRRGRLQPGHHVLQHAAPAGQGRDSARVRRREPRPRASGQQKDYAMRQKDWFDHYLKGAPAPDWMTKGIPRIKMDEYWRQLKAQQAGRRPGERRSSRDWLAVRSRRGAERSRLRLRRRRGQRKAAAQSRRDVQSPSRRAAVSLVAEPLSLFPHDHLAALLRGRGRRVRRRERAVRARLSGVRHRLRSSARRRRRSAARSGARSSSASRRWRRSATATSRRTACRRTS